MCNREFYLFAILIWVFFLTLQKFKEIKASIATNHKRVFKSNEPIMPQWKYVQPAQNAGKRVRQNHNEFSFSFHWLSLWREAVFLANHETKKHNSKVIKKSRVVFTCPSHKKRILWKRWKISSLGWWIVRITSLPDSATRFKWFSSSREDDASKPKNITIS